MANITDKTVASDKGSETGGASYSKFYSYIELVATEETSTQVRLTANSYVYLTGDGYNGNTTITYSGSLYDSSSTFACGTGGQYASKSKDLGWFNRGKTTSTYSITAQYSTSSGTTYKSTASVSYTVPTSAISLSTYTISYDANGGSGAPSKQTKWYGETLTLSSTKPTRPGYTFLGWSTSSTATKATYAAGASYTTNSAATLYAVWSEHCLTINYYANGADFYKLEGVETDIPSDELIYTGSVYYSKEYPNGLPNMQNEELVYLSRTGYSPLYCWNLVSDGSGTSINEETEFSTGQELAQALGKDLSSGNASVDVYAQWRENCLTVNYYSNYADYYGGYKEALNSVDASANVVIYTQEFKYATAYDSASTSEGLFDYTDSENALYMTRTKHHATGFWYTTDVKNVELNGGADSVLTYATDAQSGKAIGENKTFGSGQELAEALDLSLESGDASIDLYAGWVEVYTVVYDDNVDDYSVENMPASSQEKEHFATITLSDAVPERFQYDFCGWATSADGAPAYNSGDEYFADEDVTLYAVWELSASVITLYDENGNEKNGLLYIYDSTGTPRFGIMYTYDSDGNLHDVR